MLPYVLAGAKAVLAIYFYFRFRVIRVPYLGPIEMARAPQINVVGPSSPRASPSTIDTGMQSRISPGHITLVRRIMQTDMAVS